MRLRKHDVITSIRLPKEVDNKIQWIADQTYTDKSSIHRDALRRYLVQNQEFFTEEFISANSHHQSLEMA